VKDEEVRVDRAQSISIGARHLLRARVVCGRKSNLFIGERVETRDLIVEDVNATSCVRERSRRVLSAFQNLFFTTETQWRERRKADMLCALCVSAVSSKLALRTLVETLSTAARRL